MTEDPVLRNLDVFLTRLADMEEALRIIANHHRDDQCDGDCALGMSALADRALHGSIKAGPNGRTDGLRGDHDRVT